MSKMRFSAATKRQLDHYVYVLVDPRDKQIFYVGKATANNRAFDHLLAQNGEEEKHKRVRDIRASGLEPTVEILRYGLKSAQESFAVEASVIDALGLENLTNKVRGHGIDRGRQTANEVERLHGSKPVRVETLLDPYMLFFINQTYSPTMKENELYDCARQFWYNVSETTRIPAAKTRKLPYPVGLAVVESVVVRAYSVAAWFAAGTTLSTRNISKGNRKFKWEFVGQLIEKHPLVGHRLTEHGRNLPGNQLGYGYLKIAFPR
jgi:hypothetical protein